MSGWFYPREPHLRLFTHSAQRDSLSPQSSGSPSNGLSPQGNKMTPAETATVPHTQPEARQTGGGNPQPDRASDPLRAHVSLASAAKTTLSGQAESLQCGKSAGAALLGTKNSTHRTTFLCFEAICGVQIKRSSPSERTEGAILRTTAPMTPAF